VIARLLPDVIGFGIWYFGLLVFALLVLAAEIGFRIGSTRRHAAASLEAEKAGVSTVTAAMLAFVAFTLALTTGIAENRFEARRLATRDEANSIGTAWLRTGLAGVSGKSIAALIDEYARVRFEYVAAAGKDEAAAPLMRTDELQNAIWQRALPVLAGMPPTLAAMLATSLNDMFSAGFAQRYAIESRTPGETLLGLQLGAMLAAAALGYQLGLAGRRHLALIFLLLLMLSGAMVMIVDFNRPYGGFIRVDPAPFQWTIRSFGPEAPSLPSPAAGGSFAPSPAR
jgi:hypothetical protein